MLVIKLCVMHLLFLIQVYTLAKELFSMSHMFDKTLRDGPKVIEKRLHVSDVAKPSSFVFLLMKL